MLFQDNKYRYFRDIRYLLLLPIIKKWVKIKNIRSWQGSNLRGQSPLDFKSNALTTRPQLPGTCVVLWTGGERAVKVTKHLSLDTSHYVTQLSVTSYRELTISSHIKNAECFEAKIRSYKTTNIYFSAVLSLYLILLAFCYCLLLPFTF